MSKLPESRCLRQAAFRFYAMKNKALQLSMASVVTTLLAGSVLAWDPNATDLGTAVSKGDFAQYESNLSAWLNQRTPADPAKITESAMRDLLKGPGFVLALDQRHFLAKAGAGKMGAFAKSSEAHKTVLAGLLASAEVMNLFLEGGVPRTHLCRRHQDWLDVFEQHEGRDTKEAAGF